MARITKLRVEGYRSIEEPIEIMFPPSQPVVLVGENNAGKSNIVKALQLVLGPFWPGNHEPEDNEFFGRDRSRSIKIEIDFDSKECFGGRFQSVKWHYNSSGSSSTSEPIYFRGVDFLGNDTFVRNEDRDTCICMVVEAERNLNYHLSYSSKWTLLSRLMHRFHRALSNHEHVQQDLEQLFRKTKEKFHEVPEFKVFVEGLQRELSDLVSTMPHRLHVNFEAYNPVNFFHALRLQAAEENNPRALEEMGTGEQQVLALALAHAYAKAFHSGIILVIEEPEAHLHPLAQQWLSKRLRSQCAKGLQVLITTHSPAFVSIEGLEGLVVVYKENGATRVRQLTRSALFNHCINLGAPKEKIKQNNILPFYAVNATSDLLSGFFARTIILVEGPTEALALPILLSKRGLDVEREGIAIISVGGKGNLAKWYRLYRAYEIPCYIIFDNDVSEDSNHTKRRDVLKALGIFDNEAASVIQMEDWMVEEGYTLFGKDYETTLRRYFKQYQNLEVQAKAEGVDSKPFVARWVAEHLQQEKSSSGWAKIDQMKEAIYKLLTETNNGKEFVDDDIPF